MTAPEILDYSRGWILDRMGYPETAEDRARFGHAADRTAYALSRGAVVCLDLRYPRPVLTITPLPQEPLDPMLT